MDFSQFPTVLLLAISLIGTCAANFAKAYYCKRAAAAPGDDFLLNGGLSVVVAITVLVCSLFRITASVYSLIVGIAFGVVTFAQTLFYLAATTKGPISYTNVIVNMSTILTALSGWIFWQEDIGVLTLLGLAGMVACMILSPARDGGKKRAGDNRWLGYAVPAMILCAGIGLIQKVHQSSEHKDEMYFMLLVAFLTGAVLSFAAYAVIRYRARRAGKIPAAAIGIIPSAAAADKPAGGRRTLVTVGLWIVIGLGSGAGNLLNLYLSGVMSTAVFFPIVNGVPLIAILLLSFLFFKERLDRRQTLGIGLGLAATVCFCLSQTIGS